MNPHGGSTGEANANNENYWSPHLSSETQEGLLPLFPLYVADEDGFPLPEFPQPELPQEVANNNGARTDVQLQETPDVVAPESNISSSSFLATTPPDPLENLDLSLNFSLSRTTVSSAVTPSSNVERSVHGINSNSASIPRKRGLPDHASGEFQQGESSNMRQENGEIKRLATESQVRANNNVNPSPPSLPLRQQEYQFFPVRRHLNPNSARTPFAPPNGMGNTNQRRGSYGPIPSQGNFHFNGASTHSQPSPLQPSHSVRPLSLHSTSFMSSSASSVNNQTLRNATHSISSPRPHDRFDFMIPFYEHGNNMFSPVVTPVGNFPTYPPNRSYVDSDRDTACRALFGLPHQFEPSESEPLQLLPPSVRYAGRVSNARANTYHPLSDRASSSTGVPPLGSRGMPHYAAASSSTTQNLHSLRPVPQFPSLEVVRGIPSEFRSLLHSLREGRGLMIEIAPQASRGLSLETITQFMEREIFSAVDGNGPKENKEKCPVCLEEFCSGEDIGKLHSCVHKFHFDCIKQWLMQRNLCPVCRRPALEMQNEQSSVVYIFE